MESGSGADLITVGDASAEAPGLLAKFRADVMASGFDPASEWHCQKCETDFSGDEICIVRASDILATAIGQPVCPGDDCIARGLETVHPKETISRP